MENLDLTNITLEEYLTVINTEAAERAKEPGCWSPGVTSDLSFWAEYGITTAVQLGDYFDACVAKELEDEARYGYNFDDFDEEEIEELTLDQEYDDSRLVAESDLEINQLYL